MLQVMDENARSSRPPPAGVVHRHRPQCRGRRTAGSPDMTADAPTILATSIGFFSRGRNASDWRPGPIFDLAFELAGRPDRPRLCYIGTATGDSITTNAAVYGAFSGTDVRTSHLALFAMP